MPRPGQRKTDFRWAAKVRSSATWCAVGAVAGAGLYFGNVVLASSHSSRPPPPPPKLASRCFTGGSQPGQMSVMLWTPREVPVYVATLNIALNWSFSPGNFRMVTEPVNREVSSLLPDGSLTYRVAAVNGSYPDECVVQGYTSGTPSPSPSPSSSSFGWLLPSSGSP
jgi:hypothetical protein